MATVKRTAVLYGAADHGLLGQVLDQHLSSIAAQRNSSIYAPYAAQSNLRGLQSFSHLTAPTQADAEAALRLGLQHAKYPFAVFLDDETEQLDYGWDRQLLRPMAQYPDLIAISGVCAHDLTPSPSSTSEAWVPRDLVGHCAREKIDVHQLPRKFELRDVAVQAPLVVSRVKLQKLGALHGELAPLGHHKLAAEVHRAIHRCGGDEILTTRTDLLDGQAQAWLAMRTSPNIAQCASRLAACKRRRGATDEQLFDDETPRRPRSAR